MTTSAPSTISKLLKAATDAERADQESLLRIKLLRTRHRRRPDVRAKLVELAERKLEGAK